MFNPCFAASCFTNSITFACGPAVTPTLIGASAAGFASSFPHPANNSTKDAMANKPTKIFFMTISFIFYLLCGIGSPQNFE